MRAFDIPTRGFPAGPRGVETRLVRQSLPWALVIGPLALAVGWLVGGTNGLISAALGCGFAVLNLLLSAAILERAARVGGKALVYAAVGGFGFRLVALTLIVWGLSYLPFVSVAITGFVLIGTHLALLTAEAVILTRTQESLDSVLPKLRMSSIDTSEGE